MTLFNAIGNAGGGSFTKSGAGVLTMNGNRLGASGTNNVISENGNATLTLAGDFNVDLTNPAAAFDGSRWTPVNLGTFPANPFAANFSVTGFTESADVWDLVADGKIWVLTEATGELTLAMAVYTSWASTNAGGQDASVDFDMDGVSNGVKFFMNSAPGFISNPSLDGTNTIT